MLLDLFSNKVAALKDICHCYREIGRRCVASAR